MKLKMRLKTVFKYLTITLLVTSLVKFSWQNKSHSPSAKSKNVSAKTNSTIQQVVGKGNIYNVRCRDWHGHCVKKSPNK